jgi:hypothetical protein
MITAFSFQWILVHSGGFPGPGTALPTGDVAREEEHVREGEGVWEWEGARTGEREWEELTLPPFAENKLSGR